MIQDVFLMLRDVSDFCVFSRKQEPACGMCEEYVTRWDITSHSKVEERTSKKSGEVKNQACNSAS